LQDPDPGSDPDPNPDPLVRVMDPRIRIHPKMSWIRNTASYKLKWMFWKKTFKKCTLQPNSVQTKCG
jgi:hypothetical protein